MDFLAASWNLKSMTHPQDCRGPGPCVGSDIYDAGQTAIGTTTVGNDYRRMAEIVRDPSMSGTPYFPTVPFKAMGTVQKWRRMAFGLRQATAAARPRAVPLCSGGVWRTKDTSLEEGKLVMVERRNSGRQARRRRRRHLAQRDGAEDKFSGVRAPLRAPSSQNADGLLGDAAKQRDDL